jgi:hypothetical protein
MVKFLEKILIALAIFLVLGHHIFPHHHHDDPPVIEHHDDHDHDHGMDHSLFSFGHLDDIYLPGKVVCSLNGDFTLHFYILPANQFETDLIFYNRFQSFFPKNEFPPPRAFLVFHLLRGPPVS